MQIKNKVVLITGGSSGIGKATAKAFAEKGAKVIITYNKTKKGTEELCKECDAQAIKLDVCDDTSIKNAMKKIKDIDILINNAGIFLEKSFSKQSFDDIKKEIDTNLTGAIKMINACLPKLKKGIIINIASVLSKQPYGIAAVYCASKAGLNMFTRALALDLKNIKIFTVNPGLTATRMTGYAGVPPEKVAEVIVKVAEGKLRKKSGDDIDIPDVI